MTTQFTRPERPLAEMSADQLFGLKRRWYDEAKRASHLEHIERVCRELGRSLSVRYGPKYEFDTHGIRIHVDGYGGYMTVSVEDPESGEHSRVCSTHPCDGLFVPGEWLEQLEEYYEPAAESERCRKSARIERNRRELLAELGG